jgi:hypothetical protein
MKHTGNCNVNDGEDIVIQGEILPAEKRPRLANVRGVRREMAAVYHELVNGKIDSEAAKARVYTLRAIAEAIRLDEIERKLHELDSL